MIVISLVSLNYETRRCQVFSLAQSSHHHKRSTSLEINGARLKLERSTINNHLSHTNHIALNLSADNLASNFTPLLSNQLIPFIIGDKGHRPLRLTILFNKGCLELRGGITKKNIGELTDILIIRSDVDCANCVIHFIFPFLIM